MLRIVIYILHFTFISTAVFAQQAAEKLTEFSSPQGIARIERSKYKNDFYQLVNYFQPQINPVYCSVASSVIILNALKLADAKNQEMLSIAKPQTMGGGVLEYKEFSQLSFLNDKTDAIKKRSIIEFKEAKKVDGKEIYDPGLTLSELEMILKKVYKLKTKTVFADKNDDKAIEKFRADLKKYLNDDKNFIIVNFDGKILGTKTGGHISPVAAYDEESDTVLVMDVALHKGHWHFSPVKKLYEAMNSKDGENYRGYMIVSR